MSIFTNRDYDKLNTRSNVRKVILCIRHGARFPIKYVGDDNWPSQDDFWKKHSASLTPQGTIDSLLLGRNFRSKYEDIFHDKFNIKCYSSDTNRTINTAWSLINGWFPEKHISIKYKENFIDISGESIQIQIDDIFHHSKVYEQLKSWQRINLYGSDELSRIYRSNDYMDLVDRIHYYYDTSYKFISSFDKLLYTKKLYSQYIINTYHNQSIHFSLDEKEILMLKEISRLVHKYKFVDKNNHIYNQRGGIVSYQLIETIKQELLNKEDSVTIFSGHDTTLYSLASVLGIDINIPTFNGYFLIELIGDELNFIYNSDPKHSPDISRIWKDDNKYVKWEDLDIGTFQLEQFISKLTF